VDVFLAHEAPRALLGGLGCEKIDEVIEALEPALCLMGHHHRHAEGSREIPVWLGWHSCLGVVLPARFGDVESRATTDAP
jgi:hypothetical protein